MKNLAFLFYCFSVVLLLAIVPVSAQKPIVPLSAFGVWDRSNAIDPKLQPEYDYLLGIKADITWADLQPTDSVNYSWAPITAVLQKALENNQVVKTNVFVGPDCPGWIYGNGVPAVKTNDKDHPGWKQYPYYLDADYIRHYHKLIKAFSVYLRGLPTNLLDRLCFVQVMTGCTGDEAPYKGVPLDAQFNITGAQWDEFRLVAFEQFKRNFNEGEGRKIGLLFNAVDPDKNALAWKWVNDNIDPNIGFGIKGSAYVRGHHLSDEKTFKEIWTPYLINPKGMKLFSAAEMDQSFAKPLYQINVPLGFYWGALSGLNTGLCIWDVTANALEAAQTYPEIHDVYRMFNKYAPQIYPSIATAAYSIFHEGLNSANEVKFPAIKYGAVSKVNVARYKAICDDPVYKSHGAILGDTVYVTEGQVAQRDKQRAYNDAGWDIEEGNYERWITQINPETTSIGLFRVRGTIDKNSSKYDRFARSFENSSGRNAMYFKFHEEVFLETKPKSLKFKIIWLDKNAGSTWALKYQTAQGIRNALNVTGIGDNTWKTVTATITDASVGNSGVFGSDFSIVNTDATNDIFHGVEVDIERGGLTGVKYKSDNNSIQLYPNPAKSLLYWNNNTNTDKARLYSINGVLLLQSTDLNSRSIDVSHLDNGMYFLQLCKGNQVIHTAKFIKE